MQPTANRPEPQRRRVVRTLGPRACVALVALVAAAGLMTGALPACETNETATPSELDLGPTFGAEVVVIVVGRGRVATSDSGSGAIDCPSRCFARIVLDDPSTDAAAGGVTLLAEAPFGTHLERWKLETVELGARGRGPSQCSPVRRTSEPANGDEGGTFDETYTTISLRFGETKGTSPKGREAECAAYTAVPIAYVVTATFVDDFVPSFDAGVDAGVETALFEPPDQYPGAAKGIGVIDGVVYWQFEQANGLSGIATGYAEARGSSGAVLVPPNDAIRAFDVGRHVVFQDLATGRIRFIQGGEFTPIVRTNGFPTCTGLTSDSTNVYCRASSGSGSTLYSWPITGGSSQTTVYNLPPGGALVVDEPTQRFFISDETSFGPGQALVRSAPRNNNGSITPFFSTIASDQTSPRSFTVGPAQLFWIDARGNDVFSATGTSKLAAQGTPALVARSGMDVRLIAADPSSSGSHFLATEQPGTGTWSILWAFFGSSSPSVLRSGIRGLGGIAVDTAYVYWTESNGRVYRALKNGLP